MAEPAAARTPARGFVMLIGLACAVITLGGLHAVATIVGPVFLALTLAIAMSPVRVRLARRGAPVWICVIVPVALIVVLLLGMVGALAVSVAQLATLLPRYADRFQTLIGSISAALHRLGVEPAQVKHALAAVNPTTIIGFAGDLIAGVLSVTSALVLIVVLLFAMTVDALVLDRRFAEIEMDRPHLVGSLHTFAQQTCKYLLVATVFGLIVAVLDTGTLVLLSVPLPVLWGLLAFITNYIPNVGFIVGLVPPALLGLLDSGPGTMIAVIVVYCALNFVIQSLIQPRFAGQAAGLSITLTMLSLLVWTWVLGPLGAILAIPLSAFARALLLDADSGTHWVSALLGAAPRRTRRPRRRRAPAAEHTDGTGELQGQQGIDG